MRLMAVEAATALFVGTAGGKLEESSKRDGGLLREQAAAALEEAMTAVEFDEREVDVEDAFSAVVVEVTRLVVLVKDALGASRVEATALVLFKAWEELDIAPTDEEEDALV
jgi:hypothetical protein